MLNIDKDKKKSFHSCAFEGAVAGFLATSIIGGVVGYWLVESAYKENKEAAITGGAERE